MIRHSSSFFLSLILHGIILLLLFFTWQNIPSIKKVDVKEKLCVKLCSIADKKVPIKPIVSPKPKPKPKPKLKKTIKPKAKPKPVVKKVEIVKEESVIIPKKIEEIVEEIREEKVIIPKEFVKPVKQVFRPQVVQEEIIQEDTDAKQVRLEKEYLQEHILEIRKLLQENLYYPRRARQRGIVGEVMVKFKLSLNGKVNSIEIVSSKSEILSRAAIKTVEDASTEFPKPNEELVLHIPIAYSLVK